MSKGWKLVINSALITIAGVLLLAALLFVGFLWFLNSTSLKDCAWNGAAAAWIDANNSGVFDPGEQPLPNVRMHVEDIENHLKDVAYGPVTDESGKAALDVPIPGCPKVDLEVYADTPPGYRPTTPDRIHVKEDFFGNIEYGKTYYFGFAKIP